MGISSWNIIETLKVLKQLKADHMIDDSTYGAMLNGMGVAENESGLTVYSNGEVYKLTTV